MASSYEDAKRDKEMREAAARRAAEERRKADAARALADYNRKRIDAEAAERALREHRERERKKGR